MFRARMALLALPAAVMLVVCWPATAVDAATLTVTTTVDENGGNAAACSLREAIRAVNQGNNFGGCTGAGFGTNDTIQFNIPDAQANAVTRVRTITVNPAINAAGLPPIQKPVFVDGYSQVDGVVGGASPNTNTPDDGGSNALILIEVTAPGTTTGSILTVQGGSSRIVGLALTLAGGNRSGIRLETAGGNVIGGNFIGTDAGGTTDKGNTEHGINIAPDSPNNTVGGVDPADRNVISGNNDLGIRVQSGGNTIQGNLIGTDKTGTVAIGNDQSGVSLEGGPNNLVGGDTPNARNLISANGLRGIVITGAGASGNRIEGNYIGTNGSGTAGLGNQVAGIRLLNGAGNTTIGGSPERANVVSANSTAGIALFDSGGGNVISWNLIGLDASGALPLGNGLSGIELHNTLPTLIRSNVLAANGEHGILVVDCCATGSLIFANLIGTNRAGATGLGNGLTGIRIEAGTNHQIGGTTPGEGNVITGNGTDGVRILNAGVTGNSIRGNSIFANGELGTDLVENGPTANDPGDADTGANARQNFPDLTSAVGSGGTIAIRGTLNSRPNATFAIDVYANGACDDSGFGEGERFLGSTAVTTDANGNASFSLGGLVQAGADRAITATATDAAGNTSEFSRCQALEGAAQSAAAAAQAAQAAQVAAVNDPNNDDHEDEGVKPKKENEEQRQQRERTNRSNRDDYFLEGNVVGICDADAVPPCVIVANRDGKVTVLLLGEAAQAAGSIRVGDYLEADGEKQHELLFHADSVEVKRRR